MKSYQKRINQKAKAEAAAVAAAEAAARAAAPQKVREPKVSKKQVRMSDPHYELKRGYALSYSRSKHVGGLYIIAIVAFAAVAFLPLMVHDLAPIGVMEFWKVFKDIDVKSADGIVKLANSVIYAVMLLIVVINALRALAKIGKLCKKKGNREIGFNSSIYAMEKLGNIFSGSLGTVICAYFLIAILCGNAQLNPLCLIVLGAGALLRLALGYWGAKAAYYDVEDTEIVVVKREIGRFAPLFRNLLQIVAVFAIIFFFLRANTLNTLIAPLMEKNGIKNYVTNGDVMTYISIALQLLVVLCTFVLVKHATAITEYNMDGTYGKGMKTFAFFSFFVLVFAGGAVACRKFLGQATFEEFAGSFKVVANKDLDVSMLIVAAIALVMFIVECIMRKMPRHAEDVKEKVVKEREPEYTFAAIIEAQDRMNAELAAREAANAANAPAPAPVFAPVPAAAPAPVEEDFVDDDELEVTFERFLVQ